MHRSWIDRWETRAAATELARTLGRAVHPAHRLDKATSGVLLFALDAAAARTLGEAFADGDVRKRYLAIVRGWPPPECLIDHPLTRIEDGYAGPATATLAQPARTRVECVATATVPVAVDRYPTSRYALVAASPLTGRRHQLRRHLRHANHPIIGDTTYGQGRHNRLFRERFGVHRLLLAAVAIDFPHPRSGARVAISAPPAADFLAASRALGWDDAAVLAAARPPIP